MRAITIPPYACAVIAAAPVMAAHLLNGFWKVPLYQAGLTYFWAADVALNVLLPTICVSFMVLSANLWPRDYGFGSLPRHWAIGDKLIYFIGSTAALVFVHWIVSVIAWKFLWQYAPAFNETDLVPVQQPMRGFTIVYFALTAGLIEEAVYRSLPWYYIRSRFRKQRPVFLYIVTTSIVFALIHWEQGPPAVFGSFAFGIVAAYIYAKIQNAWPLVIAHTITDILVFI